MYITELSLMIGGSREMLEFLSRKLCLNEAISQIRLFHQFKFVHIHRDLWLLAFCHNNYEWGAQDEFAWSEIQYEAELLELAVSYKFSKKYYTKSDFPSPEPGDYDPDRPDRERHQEIMDELIKSHLVFDSKLKAAFGL